MALRDLVALAWREAWSGLAGFIPLPRGLSDFLIAVILASALVLLYRVSRPLFKAAIILLWGVVVGSIILYVAGG
jgi:hypothetical protein